MKIRKSQLEQLIIEAVKKQGGNKTTQKRIVESVKRKLNEDHIYNSVGGYYDPNDDYDGKGDYLYSWAKAQTQEDEFNYEIEYKDLRTRFDDARTMAGDLVKKLRVASDILEKMEQTDEIKKVIHILYVSSFPLSHLHGIGKV